MLEPWHIISQVHLRRSVTIDHRSASPQRGEAAGKASNLQKEIYNGSLNETAMVAYDYTPECLKNNGLFQECVGWFDGF